MCGHCFVPVYKTYKKDKIRDIVTLECPYCGVEVCFDEIKGEAAKGQIDELKDSVERYRQQEEFVDAGRRNLKRWNMWRNILYAGITFLVFLGFLFVGAATDPNPAHLQHI